MERTTKQQRKENAKLFWTYLKNTSFNRQAAIVIERQDSKSNPHIHRTQLITNKTNYSTCRNVIAESVNGIEGCFYELIENIHGIDVTKQIGFFEDGFEKWLKKECGLEIVFNDGLVIMIKG